MSLIMDPGAARGVTRGGVKFAFHHNPSQRQLATERSAAKRRAKAEIRRAVRAGEMSLAEVLLDQPPCMTTVRLLDLLDLVPNLGPRVITTIGRRAVRDGINLAVPLGHASSRSRVWLVEHGRRNLD